MNTKKQKLNARVNTRKIKALNRAQKVLMGNQDRMKIYTTKHN